MTYCLSLVKALSQRPCYRALLHLYQLNYRALLFRRRASRFTTQIMNQYTNRQFLEGYLANQ